MSETIAPEQNAARSDALSALRASRARVDGVSSNNCSRTGRCSGRCSVSPEGVACLSPRASSLTYKKEAVSNTIAPEQNTVRSDALSALTPSLRQGSSERLSETLALTQNTVRRYVCSPEGVSASPARVRARSNTGRRGSQRPLPQSRTPFGNMLCPPRGCLPLRLCHLAYDYESRQLRRIHPASFDGLRQLLGASGAMNPCARGHRCA